MIKSVDDLVLSGRIRDKIIIQIGYTNYIPKECKWFKFVDPQKFENLCKKSDIVITHGGVGSIMTLLKLNKPIIAVPRLKRFYEHTDNHQLQIVKELEKQKRLIAVYDTSDLFSAIKRVRKFNPKKRIQKNSKIFKIVDEQLIKWKDFYE